MQSSKKLILSSEVSVPRLLPTCNTDQVDLPQSMLSTSRVMFCKRQSIQTHAQRVLSSQSHLGNFHARASTLLRYKRLFRVLFTPDQQFQCLLPSQLLRQFQRIPSNLSHRIQMDYPLHFATQLCRTDILPIKMHLGTSPKDQMLLQCTVGSLYEYQKN